MDKLLEEKLTRGGRIPLPVGATAEKLVAADQILEGISKGDPYAVAEFKSHLGARYTESLTTGDDFIFAFTHLVGLEVDEIVENEERTWQEVIPTRTVQTFEGPKVYSIDPELKGFARPVSEPGKPAHIAPIVPEGAPYPEFTFAGEVAAGGGIHKAGGAFGLTFERIVSNPQELVPQLPTIISEFLLDREEWDAWSAILGAVKGNEDRHLKAGETLAGEAVATDARMGRASIALAVRQLLQRKDAKGRSLGLSNLTMLVPVGGTEEARFYMNHLTLTDIISKDADLDRNLAVSNYNPYRSITKIVESEYVTGSQWGLVPTKGTLRGNKRFIELGRLAGHEGPEIRVENVAGNYVGGGAVGPFEGSFQTDTARMRGRIICGGLEWDSSFGLWSDGDGTTPPIG